jgi:hypothetical protein
MLELVYTENFMMFEHSRRELRRFENVLLYICMEFPLQWKNSENFGVD